VGTGWCEEREAPHPGGKSNILSPHRLCNIRATSSRPEETRRRPRQIPLARALRREWRIDPIALGKEIAQMEPSSYSTGQPGEDAYGQPPATGTPVGSPATGTPGEAQRTEGEGKEPRHTHAPITHSHDHYHVSHHHRGGPLGEWEHRTHWHTHEHNHAGMTHSHDYDRDDEEQQHGKEAHIHDHSAPAQSPA
jgi:hypothetical protein